MLETLLEQAPSLTPTSLILLLNVLIATILISSAFHKHHHDNENNHDHNISSATPPPPNPPQLARAPSLFSRVTSFNFSHNHHYPDNHHDDHHPQLYHTQSSPSLLSRVTSFKLMGHTETQPDPDHQDVTQSCPVTPAASADRVNKSMRRAPSFLSRVASFPLGMRNAHIETGEVNTHDQENSSSNDNKEEKAKKSSKKKKNRDEIRKRNEAEVDAKADAFINKFKQQLKLQRLDSFTRYRMTTAT